MSIVNSIETVRDWLTAEVCPLVKLKLPDDNATDASYPYKLVNPAAFSLFVPSKDRTPPNIAAPIPSVCVQIVQGDDDLLQSARDIKIRLCFSAWDPGYHGPDIFKPKGDGSGTYIQQYERIKGIDRTLIDKPSETAATDLAADVEFLVETYEPRVQLSDSDLKAMTAQAGDFELRASIDNIT